MPKFRVRVTMETFLHADIEAADADEAYEIADNMDGGDFVEDSPPAGGWVIEDVIELLGE